MKEIPKIIVDGRGTERSIGSYPDKKQRPFTFQSIDEELIHARNIFESFEIGQREATFYPRADFYNKPIVVVLMTDTHYGSVRTDTKLLNRHLDIVESTPNFFMVHNGDHTDNFNATGKWASGVYENPMPPQIQARAWGQKLLKLDRLQKIVALGFGNHDNFAESSGQDYHDSFMSHFNTPIITTGGMIHIIHEGAVYHLAMTHKYWGTSKLNPTNACKRFLDFEYPYADIVFLGHTHQSEGLHFEKGGRDIIGVIGGTYKDNDTWARKNGIGGRAGTPGWAVALYPFSREMVLFKDLEVARKFIR